jgi:predicted RNA binding protein YcfA (HicA-like mRNA interferase family)
MMVMTGSRLLALLLRLGCVKVRQRGSHVRVRCGDRLATIPVHAGAGIGPGLLRSIDRDLRPCLGEGWLKR